MVEKQEGMILGRPEVSSVALQAENDFLILACDGLWDVMDSRRAVEQAKIFLRSSWDPEACARHLALEACARGTTDNVSVVVATLRASPFKARAGAGRCCAREGRGYAWVGSNSPPHRQEVRRSGLTFGPPCAPIPPSPPLSTPGPPPPPLGVHAVRVVPGAGGGAVRGATGAHDAPRGRGTRGAPAAGPGVAGRRGEGLGLLQTKRRWGRGSSERGGAASFAAAARAARTATGQGGRRAHPERHGRREASAVGLRGRPRRTRRRTLASSSRRQADANPCHRMPPGASQDRLWRASLNVFDKRKAIGSTPWRMDSAGPDATCHVPVRLTAAVL